MKLELKHLAPYLPYKLRVMNRGEKKVMNGATGWSNHWIGIITLVRYAKDCKPILRPLSDLTKEIEHNGEKFVPVEKILNEVFDSHWNDKYYRHYEPDISTGVAVINRPTSNIIYSIHYNNMDSTRYDIMQWLFAHHFDIFGLTEQGLAIKL